MEKTKKPVKAYPAELRERAVRMVREHAGDHQAGRPTGRNQEEAPERRPGRTPRYA